MAEENPQLQSALRALDQELEVRHAGMVYQGWEYASLILTFAYRTVISQRRGKRRYPMRPTPHAVTGEAVCLKLRHSFSRSI